MTKLLQISQLGHEVLRKKASFVENINNKEIQDLIDDMINTVKDSNGVGIAAPQVYESIRIFIVASNPSQRYPDAPKMEPTAIINPEIVYYSDEILKDWEGCLSIPGVRAMVPRNKSIEVEYTDRDGNSQKCQFEGFIARIFQHEYDHLEGLVFLDRLDSTKDIITEKEYQKIISK
ncbi:MAG: peptide deformylase [Candidatus Gracilibacteria bacterium]|nr:peptide deformylase [Candidatus Gracilibacteria bacterium]